MKKFYHWGYGESELRSGDTKYRDVRYIAFTTKGKFINAVRKAQAFNKTGVKWISNRMSPIGNKGELELLLKYPDKLLKVDGLTNELLAIYTI